MPWYLMPHHCHCSKDNGASIRFISTLGYFWYYNLRINQHSIRRIKEINIFFPSKFIFVMLLGFFSKCITVIRFFYQSLMSKNNLPRIILHDGVILLHYGTYYTYWETISWKEDGSKSINSYMCSIYSIYVYGDLLCVSKELGAPTCSLASHTNIMFLSFPHQHVFLAGPLPLYYRRLYVSGSLNSAYSLLVHMWLLHNILLI